ncbi:tripartite tricarboxylate transporter substrate binding protein [uncultured Azohydromonas sp.]|uniref:Bug family tripartite tricarboxylate transporter substrate binding protein n=1 Tax=uncultured Azohydromonas sp. TaxID=487342 RepID=UPI002612885D|nr:tripartite tricarboxylate transporter substrate binding protein [uncultured Azohydromonas sp.]
MPYSAGGTTDYVARLLQKPLGELLNQTVVIENKPGAAGTIGTHLVAKAPPDGNTIVFGNQGPNAIVPASRKTPYDPLDDLRPLTTVAFMPLMLMVSAEKGPATLGEFMQQARKASVKWNYGSSGIGSLAHLTGYKFSHAGGLDMMHVPYQGGSAVLTAVMQGDVQGSFVSGLETASMMQSGKLRYLGVASPRRIATLPDVPAIAEEIPGFESVLWFAVFAPKGTSDATAQRLRTAVVKAVERPEFQNYLAQRHAQARTSTPQELTQLIKQDMARWGDTAREADSAK